MKAEEEERQEKGYYTCAALPSPEDALLLSGATFCACGRSAWYWCVGAVDDTLAMDTALIDTVVGVRTDPTVAFALGLGLDEEAERLRLDPVFFCGCCVDCGGRGGREVVAWDEVG